MSLQLTFCVGFEVFDLNFIADSAIEQQLVSKAMDFSHREGNDVDFTKTFDLTGNDNDQMLKFYLRKAGLSDNIEYLTSEQRRAFIYDIVKSNKNPGYWKPSVLPQTPTPPRGPFHKPPVERESSISINSINDIPPASMTFDLDAYRQTKNTSSYSNVEHQGNLLVEQRANTGSTLYERQFSQKLSNSSTKVSNTNSIPLPTTTLRTRKGRIIEVSGPKNFRHLNGDMTRDMTKNCFDLSGNVNNNSLKKYMIERGITEEDVSWLERKDLIKRIVQSNYTWTPHHTPRERNAAPPPPSERHVSAERTAPSSPRNINISKGGAIIVTPPVLPEAIAQSNEPVYEEIVQPKHKTTSIRRNRRKPTTAPPPPPPPPPVPVPIPINVALSTNYEPPTPPPMPVEQCLRPQNCPPQTPPTPPPPPPHPPMPIENTDDFSPPPPQPPPIPIQDTLKTTRFSPLPRMSIEENLRAGNVPPPPPPPPPMLIDQARKTENCMPPPPPKPMGILPPPKPLLNTTASKPNTQFKPTQSGNEPNRNAFLESIRSGVTLKKVTTQENKQLKNNVKAPGVTTQSQHLKASPDAMKQDSVQLEKTDFMSELRNATLKRIKKLDNNPYASESDC